MNGYTKLFSSIVASTIWRESHATKVVWITMLAMANRDGEIGASIPGLADMARVTLQEVQEALKALMSPDPYSRTKEHEGRRICEVDGGWVILNHAKYRAKMSKDERREYLTRKQAERRARMKSANECVNTVSTGVNVCDTESTQAEANADSYANADPLCSATAETPQRPQAGIVAATQQIKSPRRKAEPITDEWLQTLASRYAYADVPVEFSKATSWIELRPGRRMTRAFFVNWLNRIEPPSEATAPGKVAPLRRGKEHVDALHSKKGGSAW